MYELTIRPAGNSNRRLTFELGSPYQIVDIEGLAPMAATINMTELALRDGARFENAKVNPRTVNIAMALDFRAEEARLEAYKVLRLKSRVIINYKTQLRNCSLTGYVQSVNVSHFAKKQILTTSIICPSPHWVENEIRTATLSETERLFHFPFTIPQGEPIPFGEVRSGEFRRIENGGDVEVPLEFILTIASAVTGITIENGIGQQFRLLGSYQAGDMIDISSVYGLKTVFLRRGNQSLNIFNQIDIGSHWMTLPTEGEEFKISVEEGALSAVAAEAQYQFAFEGV